jgi:hypothetical protein
MRRVFLVVVAVAVSVSTLLWLLHGTTLPVMAASGQVRFEQDAPGQGDLSPVQRALELEMAETGGADAPVSTMSAVEASADLTDVHIMPDYKTVPDTLPRVIVTRGTESLADGYYFLTNSNSHRQPTPNGLMIVNDEAQLVYYQVKPQNIFFDLKRLDNGTLAYFDESVNGYKVLDSTYALSDTWVPGNGYPVVDFHDFQLLSNGNVAFMIYDQQPLDLSAYGGRADAEVVDLVIQEMDPDHNVVFTWNSRDHIAITDTYVSLNDAVVDYVHGNAIEEDSDGNFLLSSRHLSEITKIDRHTGDIIWRLGGKNNEFTFIGDPTLPNIGAFSYQHDIRHLPNGHITLFDDGNQFIDANLRGSRGVEYELDVISKTATLVKEFRTVPETYATFMGSMQRLENGNTLVGWGGGLPPLRQQPNTLTEFTPDGDAALYLGYLDSTQLSYRARKFTWHGFPTTAPLLVVVTDTIPAALYYSWNGATDVVSYAVKGGELPLDLQVIAEQAKTDFEDSTSLENVDRTLCFFQVIPSLAQNGMGQPSAIEYVGDDTCTSGLTANNSQMVSRSFTYTQSSGNVTTTLTLLPGEFVSPTIFVLSPDPVAAASVPEQQTMSDIHFSLHAFEGEALSEVAVFTAGVQLTVDYGALDLSHTPLDVSLLRWDDATQSWSSDGLTLLQQDNANQRLVYTIQRTGEFALFVANRAPQSASVLLLTNEDESLNFSADQFPYFDLDGDPLGALAVETLPLSGSLTYSGTPVVASQVISPESLSKLVFTPAADEFGLPYTTFRYRVSDSFTQSVPYTVTIAVSPVNDKPVAADDEAVISDTADSSSANPEALQAVAVSVPVLANDFDVDGDTLKIVSTTDGAHGTAVISGDQVIYTTTDLHEGLDTFTYTVDDGHGGQATATVTIQRGLLKQYLPRLGH